ncbi:MAG TPA: tyrosine-type recombinase/integrase [Candidatus Methanoperedens sp.]|nr:tyrosine-type recombinase/integrase [Candidatus Methanoperedens sp.]
MRESDVMSEYLDYLKGICGYRPATLRLHERAGRLWKTFLEAQRGKGIFQALPEDLLAYIEHRQSSGAVKNASLSAELCVLRTFYAYLNDYGKIFFNPAASLPELICRPPAEKEYLSVEECFQMLEAFQTEDPLALRNYTVIALLWSTGLRNNELCSLNWRDLDLEDKTLRVLRGKGGKQRQIFLNDRVCEDLRRYRARLGGGAGDPVFFSFSVNAPGAKKHARMSPSHLDDMIRLHARAVGISKPVNPLTFRHTFATHMFEAGVGLEDIKEMLGHDLDTETTTYVHVTIEAAKRLLNEHLANPAKFFRRARR